MGLGRACNLFSYCFYMRQAASENVHSIWCEIKTRIHESFLNSSFPSRLKRLGILSISYSCIISNSHDTLKNSNWSEHIMMVAISILGSKHLQQWTSVERKCIYPIENNMHYKHYLYKRTSFWKEMSFARKIRLSKNDIIKEALLQNKKLARSSQT